MIKTNFQFILCLCSFFLIATLSCKKKQSVTNHEIISTPVSTRINKSFWLNKNVGFICGGEKSSIGYIYKTIDGGNTWANGYSSATSLYDILFVNDTVGYCCGENMVVLKTIDAGVTWQSFIKTSNYDDFFNGTLFGITNLNNRVWFFGGKNFNIGFVITTQGNKMRDGFKGFSNELRFGILSDTNTYLACGYGLGYKTYNNAESFSSVELGNDYFTAASIVNQNLSFLSGFNGKVYRYNSSTNESIQIFQTKKKLKKQMQFNSLFFESETKGWVVGNEGAISKTNDGKMFEILNLGTTSNLLSIVSNKNNELIISTEKGELIKISN